MINKLRIQNLRSIKDSFDIELKPIMILVGANSSGKSTFLRSFPLFSQSVDKKLRGPIAWFDTSFVDYGDYKTAKNRYSSEQEGIIFSYEMSNVDVSIRRNFYPNVEILNNNELTSNPQPIGFRGNLLVKRQKFFYCTYSLGITETS